MSKKHRKQLKQFKAQVDVLKGSLSDSLKGLDILMHKLPIEQQEILRDVQTSVNDAIATNDIDKLNEAIEKANKL